MDNEPGVVCIYPMVQKRDSSKVRILEIYRDTKAYHHYISTPWFQTYKQGMLHEVKHLDLAWICSRLCLGVMAQNTPAAALDSK